MTHTVNSLLKLADGYVMTYPHGDYKAKRAALSTAITEVLAELAEAKNDAALDTVLISDLQSKCESQAAEIERLNAAYHDMHEEFTAKVAEMEKQEPVGIVAVLPNGVWSVGWGAGHLPKHNDKLYLSPGAAQKPRCELCNYDYGHAIGCDNNPVDIALKQAAPAAQKCGYDETTGNCTQQDCCRAQAAPAAQRLTDDQIDAIRKQVWLTRDSTLVDFARAIEAAHGIGAKEQQA